MRVCEYVGACVCVVCRGHCVEGAERKVLHRRNKDILDRVPIFGNLAEEQREKLAGAHGLFTPTTTTTTTTFTPPSLVRFY